MDKNLIYMPTFRYRQQEGYVLNSFNFGENMYPLIEIVKAQDRKTKTPKDFAQVYLKAIQNIKANRIFIDLPIYLKQARNVKPEVNDFIIRVISNLEKRCEYLNKLSAEKNKIIPVISSYYEKNRALNTITAQEKILRANYDRIAFRIYINSFEEDFSEIQKIVTTNDYLIIDLDKLHPFINKTLKPIFEDIISFNKCTKILLRSAINSDIENVKLDHGKVVKEVDNSHIENSIFQNLGCNAVGDYVGIKKDNLTSGGSISPGFIYYDAIDNKYFGYKAKLKGELQEFQDTIVPDVLSSQSTINMLNIKPPFLTEDNWGFRTLYNINKGNESGKSQSKFKRISMEHYLFCMQSLIDRGSLLQANM